MRLRKEIAELLDAGIIDAETATRINTYYDARSGPPANRLLLVFGILGALLISLGIILILAHNWDELSRTLKTVIAFVPLVLGQVLCAYTLLKRRDSPVWREASSSFLFIAIGASISLVSQIYHITGSIPEFLLSWMIVAFPIIYIMRSSMASLLFIIAMTWYACDVGYWGASWPLSPTDPYVYWLFLLLIIPHYYLLYRDKAGSNFFTFHNWMIPLSLTIVLGTFAAQFEELMLVAYVSMFGLFYLIGNIPIFRNQKIRNNGFLIIGSLGTVVMLLILSFDFFWPELREEKLVNTQLWTSPEFIISAVLTLAALGLLIYQKTKERPFDLRPVEFVFPLFILVFIIGTKSEMAILFTNLLVFAIGVLTIREGAEQDNLGILNYGLLIITALVVCRFFDTDLGFVLKGILFVAVGLGFFFANYWMMKKRKSGAPDLISK
ncbi:MAG TPA: DUF2157 domain-containing protein [Saprospiraceae bacterium]|nr:DUF2157 domain-containing protein [Saprospiraceae bacterium]